MASTLQIMLRVKGKSRPQTDVRSGGESRSGMHNPKVVGSNPTPATLLQTIAHKAMVFV